MRYPRLYSTGLVKRFLFFTIFVSLFFSAKSQNATVRFIHISDTHISTTSKTTEEDLERIVEDINKRNDVSFVIITGDITEMGTDEELKLAKIILDKLNKPWYIIPGNHDTGWSESGGKSFNTTFGYDKFVFDFAGIRFIGCASGPYVRMSDGHIPRDAIRWMDSIFSNTSSTQPVIFFNHYPLDPGLDNWYEAIDRLRTKNTLFISCGHLHINKVMNFDGIPAFTGRSTLRAKDATGGYNVVEIRKDSVFYTEHRPGTDFIHTWGMVSLGKNADRQINISPRPDFSMNQKYPNVIEEWTFQSDANIISTPLVQEGLVIFGNQQGTIEAVYVNSGKSKWKIQTSGAIFSSPATCKKNFIIASADGNIYSFRQSDGKENWRHKTDAAVLGSPKIFRNMIFIGGSDHRFRALDGNSGTLLWSFDSLQGPVVSTPVFNNETVIFGAWDGNLYALNKLDGKLKWKWNNGSVIRHYAPAACSPVIVDSVVYVVAPDRYISAIDFGSGKTLWRNNDAAVRESIGISANGKWIYAKTMQDTIVAYAASKEKQMPAWKMNCGFGYEHAPSMLIENKGLVYFSTRNGVVYCIDPAKKEIVWAHKIDNSMVNTVNVLKDGSVVAATMDGRVVLLSSPD